MDVFVEELLVTDAKTGRATGLAKTIRRVLQAMSQSGIPYCVIGATALAARGIARHTRDLDLTVLLDDGQAAIRALRDAGLRAETPTGPADDPEPMVVFLDPVTKVEVDLLIAAGDPEATAIESAKTAEIFGVAAPVATLEQLLLLYLYSNQPKHLGDFAAIVRSAEVDLRHAEEMLAIMHPEMLPDFHERVRQAQSPAPPPSRPKPRPRRR